MIAAWMLYCALCALGLSLAAVLAERVMLAGRGPVRHVWIVAVALSVMVPAVAFRFAPRVASNPATVVPTPATSVDSLVDQSRVDSPSGLVSPARTIPRWNWRASLAAADAPLTVVWLTLSSALVAHFFCGVIALSWMRRWWRRDTVLGVDVLVSEATGPALVGAVSPAIVVPEWALSMDPRQVALMLRHEEEHRRARDGQLLTVAQFAVIAMPWNVALWWQLVRLRVAVELDCDARVLRDADARSYGDLLLEVARPRRRLTFMGATAFAERASQLERRIRAIGSRREQASRGARISAACVGLAALTAAWIAPRPPAPARVALPFELPVSPTAVLHDSVRVTPLLLGEQTSVVSSTPAQPIARVVHDTATRSAAAARSQTSRDSFDRKFTVLGDSMIITPSDSMKRVVIPGAVVVRPLRVQVASPQIDSLFEQLFQGIPLTPDQEASARALLTQLQIAQFRRTVDLVRALTESLPRRQAIQAAADSALLSLLTSDADRATVRSRFVLQVPGGRGRSNSPGLDVAVSSGGERVGGGGRGARGGGGGGFSGDTAVFSGARGGGGGRGGGGVGRGGLPADPTDAVFRRLFDGVTLAPEQEAEARGIIGKMQTDIRMLLPPPGPPIIARRGNSNQVVMGAESAAAFASMLTNDADRATLMSRIVVEVPITGTTTVLPPPA